MIFTVAVPTCQMFSEVLAKAGQRVALPCHSTTEESVKSLTFFWYKQFPGKALRFLLKTAGNGKLHKGEYTAIVYINKTALLEIGAVSLRDTAIYYCALQHHLKLSQVSVHTKSVSPTAQEG
uniref:Ig-like domain-containing protein n=1 Tax=Malurus cyaneus samueli TaxID=2593467 RepID=A0A8C5TPP7_9PASS